MHRAETNGRKQISEGRGGAGEVGGLPVDGAGGLPGEALSGAQAPYLYDEIRARLGASTLAIIDRNATR